MMHVYVACESRGSERVMGKGENLRSQKNKKISNYLVLPGLVGIPTKSPI
jgi:hypothetical protein